MWSPEVARCAEAQAGAGSAGGVEDPAHLGPLARQLVVLGHGSLRLQDSHVDAFLLDKVQGGSGNLRDDTAHTLMI